MSHKSKNFKKVSKSEPKFTFPTQSPPPSSPPNEIESPHSEEKFKDFFQNLLNFFFENFHTFKFRTYAKPLQSSSFVGEKTFNASLFQNSACSEKSETNPKNFSNFNFDDSEIQNESSEKDISMDKDTSLEKDTSIASE